MKNLKVNKKYDGKKLSKYILETNKEFSYGTFCNLLRKKDIKVNEKRINKDILVYENDEITIYIKEEFEKNLTEKNKQQEESIKQKFKLNIVYEDENILIINKPKELEVQGKNSLEEYLVKTYNYKFAKPCHRLDRNTSGLIIFAKNEISEKILLEKFKNHEIKKHYLALVYGIPEESSKRLEAYLFKDNKKSMVYIYNTPRIGTKKIITKYTIVKTNKLNNTTLLDVEIETGRTHQIRAHLAYIGYPIIGDGKYGKNEINKKYNKKYQELTSCTLEFEFINDTGILNYLNGKVFEI